MLKYFIAGLLLLELSSGTRISTDPTKSVLPAKLYVVNQRNASIHVIDQQTFEVDTVLDLTAMTYSSNARPHHVAVEKDGSAWYVSLIGENRILKFDRANHLLGTELTEAPGLLQIDPVHDSLYAGRSMTAPTPPRSLAVIKRSSFVLTNEEPIQIARPHALVSSASGQWVHSASLAENRIASVNLVSGQTVLSTIPGTFRSFVQFAVSPDGRWLAATAELSNSIVLFDLGSPMPLKVTRELALPGKPWDCQFSKDGEKLFVSLMAENAIAELNVHTGAVERRFAEGLSEPYSLVIRADGNYLFAVNQNSSVPVPKTGNGHDHMASDHDGTTASSGWVSVIDLKSGRSIKKILVGRGPTGSGSAGSR
jgi:DNA-binding beta-propeller fold protein YncE